MSEEPKTTDINLDRWLIRGGTLTIVLFLLAFCGVQLAFAVQQRNTIIGLQIEVDAAREAHGKARASQEQCFTALQRADAQLELVNVWMKTAAEGRK